MSGSFGFSTDFFSMVPCLDIGEGGVGYHWTATPCKKNVREGGGDDNTKVKNCFHRAPRKWVVFVSRGMCAREGRGNTDHGGGWTMRGGRKPGGRKTINSGTDLTSPVEHTAKTRCRRRTRRCVTITKMEAWNEASSRLSVARSGRLQDI